MNLNYRGLALCFALVACSMAMGAQPNVTPEQLQQLLKRYPDADTNHDGTLSADETRAYRQKLAGSRKGKGRGDKPSLPPPTHANVSYGPHERNVLDLWIAPSGKPTPLVVFIHGGCVVSGNKSQVRPEAIRRCLDAGVSVMSINYRFLSQAPVQDILRDAARAIQFVRANAARYNLDSRRIAAYGGSAG